MMPKLARDKSAILDEIFNENYLAIKRWANIVAKNDEALSEDLVHDVFIKFRCSSSELTEVENIKGFLFTAIRNTYISQLRRKTLRREVSISDDLPVTAPGLVHDPRSYDAVREQLLEICYYACKRKEKSLSASILLLRHFHGYHPAEIKKIVKRSKNSVEARMSKIRAEVKDHLDGIEQKDTYNRGSKKESNIPGRHVTGDELTTEIRAIIFSHPSGRCLELAEWRKLYLKFNEISREDLSHIVSCFDCLESINTMLRMPLLSQRHPFDSCYVPSTPTFLEHVRAGVLTIFLALIPNLIDFSFVLDLGSLS